MDVLLYLQFYIIYNNLTKNPKTNSFLYYDEHLCGFSCSPMWCSYAFSILRSQGKQSRYCYKNDGDFQLLPSLSKPFIASLGNSDLLGDGSTV